MWSAYKKISEKSDLKHIIYIVSKIGYRRDNKTHKSINHNIIRYVVWHQPPDIRQQIIFLFINPFYNLRVKNNLKVMYLSFYIISLCLKIGI